MPEQTIHSRKVTERVEFVVHTHKAQRNDGCVLLIKAKLAFKRLFCSALSSYGGVQYGVSKSDVRLLDGDELMEWTDHWEELSEARYYAGRRRVQ
ncbi:hypothetical protein [Mucisphaera sp.]|uniref:hypothetical protein n=1 Tax=Mucisphaera sp. TaxID=2913024 RepID=UPI003D1476FD